MKYTHFLLILSFLIITNESFSQKTIDSSLLTVDRVVGTEFRQDRERTIQWIENGESYITIEKSTTLTKTDELIKYNSQNQKRSIFVPASDLVKIDSSLKIESFSLSPDGSKVLIFTNSSRVWRDNTKGDYWAYDLKSKYLRQLGSTLPSSSLMFAKFSTTNDFVCYVQAFNLYKEDFKTGTITQLTSDGDGKIINGTFDWAYEEEFGKRDGFSISPDNSLVAYWQLNASEIGTFYMINNIDSVYSEPIPLQYPKVGKDPSSAKIGLIDLATNKTHWISIPGDPVQNYLPGMQWINKDLLLIQQMNRHQNQLLIWTYQPSTTKLNKVYTETEETWVDLGYPDISSNSWGNNDLPMVDKNKAFLRMTENDAWRHIYKVELSTGKKTLVTPFENDVASMRVPTDKGIFYIASPENSTQRYLYTTDLDGKGKQRRITPQKYSGINNYNISPNGKYAVHSHESAQEVRTVRFITLPNHRTIKVLVDNAAYKQKLAGITMPKVGFSKVTTEDGIEIDVRTVYPVGFDSSQKYPVLFHVYGEPWGQVATDSQVGMWNAMMAQRGYLIIDMDNRGTPCLKGSEWRKSIYKKVGILNTHDQAQAAKEILKLDYIDANRTAVWGWSGGGSMTLNLLFKHPEIYKTGISIAAVSNQLIYDNIYQERYMGLPQENMQDFIDGSPITHAKNLDGNLLLIHGTADDNVHYQSAELLINELIKENKIFQFMAYPNRSHGIWEGENTRRHLYTLMTDYIMKNTPSNYSRP